MIAAVSGACARSACRHALRAALSLTLAAGLTGAAAAAEKQPPLIPSWKQSHFEEANPAVRSVYMLAVCSKKHRRAAGEALLASAPDSAEEASLIRAATSLVYADCPVRFPRTRLNNPIVMRGAIAEAIYKGDRMKPRRADLPFDEAFRPSDRESATAVARWVARCAVHRKPLLAHPILSFNPGAIGEANALRSLKPSLAACLPEGERLQISRLEFRALIAEQLYHASVRFKESFANAQG